MVMKRKPVDSYGHITFGKHIGEPLSSLPDSYLKWYISVEPRTSYSAPFQAELDRCNGKPAPTRRASASIFDAPVTPPTPHTQPPPKLSVFDDPTPIVLLKAVEEEQDDDNDELTVYTKETITPLLTDAYDRGYKQAYDVLNARIRAMQQYREDFRNELTSAIKPPSAFQSPVNPSTVTVLLTRNQVQEVVSHAVTQGFNAAYGHMSSKIQALKYDDAFKNELTDTLGLVRRRAGFRMTSGRRSVYSELFINLCAFVCLGLYLLLLFILAKEDDDDDRCLFLW